MIRRDQHCLTSKDEIKRERTERKRQNERERYITTTKWQNKRERDAASKNEREWDEA